MTNLNRKYTWRQNYETSTRGVRICVYKVSINNIGGFEVRQQPHSSMFRCVDLQKEDNPDPIFTKQYANAELAIADVEKYITSLGG